MDWVPRYTGVAPRDQCKLTCQARALGYYYVLEPRVRTRNLQAQSGPTHLPVILLISDKYLFKKPLQTIAGIHHAVPTYRFTQSCLSLGVQR